MKIVKKILFLAVFVMALHMSLGQKVYAAEGQLIIALSESNVAVGNKVQVTLSALGSAGESAVADMEFSYDASVFSFVSCNADNYSGGAGGKVSVTGSKVVVTLEAIDNGSARVVVTGSNGRTKDSGEALEEMVAAGATIQAGSTENSNNNSSESENQNNENNSGESVKSNDNSLAALSLSAGELSPEFSYAITTYTVVVPYDVTTVEVNAQPTAEKATIESVIGNSDLQVGENTIEVTVKAEDGSKSLYTILVTREADVVQESQGEDIQETPQDQDTEAIVDNAQMEEYESNLALWEKEYNKLKEKYEEQKSTSKKIILILVFVIIVLVIVCVNLLIFRRTNNEEEDFEEIKEEKIEKKAPVKSTTTEEKKVDPVQPKAPRKMKKNTSKRDIEIIDFDEL